MAEISSCYQLQRGILTWVPNRWLPSSQLDISFVTYGRSSPLTSRHSSTSHPGNSSRSNQEVHVRCHGAQEVSDTYSSASDLYSKQGRNIPKIVKAVSRDACLPIMLHNLPYIGVKQQTASMLKSIRLFRSDSNDEDEKLTKMCLTMTPDL